MRQVGSRTPAPSIVLAGFEPFGAAIANPSWLAVERVAAARTDVLAVELAVEFGAGSALVRLLEDLPEVPAIVLAVGMAEGRTAVTPERLAANERTARIPDNAGRSPRGEPVDASGPPERHASLPVDAIVNALEARGVAAEASVDAGRYVCNDTFYELQGWLDAHRAVGGFVHVPATAEAGLPASVPTVPLATVERAVAVTLEVCALSAAAGARG